MTLQIYLRHVWCAVKFKAPKEVFFGTWNAWDANACKVYIRVILFPDARFNVARNMRTSFAAGSTCLRMVYSICSKMYRGTSQSRATKENRELACNVVQQNLSRRDKNCYDFHPRQTAVTQLQNH